MGHSIRRWVFPSKSRNHACSGCWWCLKVSSWGGYGAGAEASGPDALTYRQLSSVAPVSDAAVGHPALACHFTMLHSQAMGKARRVIRVINDATCEGTDISPFHLSYCFQFLHCFNIIGRFFSFLSIDLFLFLFYIYAADTAEIVAIFLPRNNYIWQWLNQILRKYWVTEHRVGRKTKVAS